MTPAHLTGVVAVTLCLVTACAAAPDAPAGESNPPSSLPTASLAVSAQQRLAALEAAVDAWQRADDLASARAAAEVARNLVTGPEVTGYGDLDGDGDIGGSSGIGLLPGEQGQPALVTSPAPDCVERDVLGGSWADPASRWEEVRTRIAAWSPTENTFPALPSHPQRVVGWASLTLSAPSLELAREYAGHAQLHVRVTRAALDGC